MLNFIIISIHIGAIVSLLMLFWFDPELESTLQGLSQYELYLSGHEYGMGTSRRFSIHMDICGNGNEAHTHAYMWLNYSDKQEVSAYFCLCAHTV